MTNLKIWIASSRFADVIGRGSSQCSARSADFDLESVDSEEFDLEDFDFEDLEGRSEP